MMREGFDVARCTALRLMQSMGLQGVIRGKPAGPPFRTNRRHARSIT